MRADLEEFLRRLPLPTIILRWNLKPIYQNNAAREFCAVWEKGPDEAKRTKANSSIPPEIVIGVVFSRKNGEMRSDRCVRPAGPTSKKNK